MKFRSAIPSAVEAARQFSSSYVPSLLRQLPGTTFALALSKSSNCDGRVRAASQKDEEEAMEKIAGLPKNSKKVFLSVLVAVSILWTGSPVHAVGPYFENESPREQGPNPAWPRPDEPLWSPSKPQIPSIESLKKGDIILRNSKQSSKTETAAPDVVDASADKRIARR
jgi:hypothetical protein